MSFDAISSLQEWAEEEEFEFELWQDTNRSLAVHYGAVDDTSALVPDRVTVLLNENGDQILNYDVGWGFGTHPEEVLEDCEAIWGE